MKELKIHNTNGYSVYIGSQVTKTVLPSFCVGRKVLIVTDSNVAPLWLDYTKDIIGNGCMSITIPASEKSKSADSLMSIWQYLSDNGFGRNDLIVALGGGTIGDLAGFAAATYMRGIDFIQMPTTLLSCIDSSVGGKNGIDFGGYKNIVGTFRRPLAVVCDTDYLNTLPEEQIRCGMGELLKYSFACDKTISDIADKFGYLSEESIYACLMTKKKFVESDEFDKGERAVLNFGHTVGHALEVLSDFTISHGEAVAMGMSVIIKAEKVQGMIDINDADMMLRKLDENGFIQDINYSPDDIVNAMKKDKKKIGDKIRFVLLKKSGDAYIHDFDYNDAVDFIRGGICK